MSEKRAMVVTIHQPDFAPWLGFFHRWAESDLYVVLDDVQFIRRGWHHRDKIKTVAGPQWLTVPILKKGKYKQKINQTLIDNSQDWQSKHLSTITRAYSKCPGFPLLFPELENVYGTGHERLKDFNLDLLALFARHMGITTPMVMASNFPSNQTSTARLVDLVVRNNGTAYMTGTGARDYLNEALFTERGIRLIWKKYEPVPYRQTYGGFEPGLSVIDYLMNTEGPAGGFTHVV